MFSSIHKSTLFFAVFVVCPANIVYGQVISVDKTELRKLIREIVQEELDVLPKLKSDMLHAPQNTNEEKSRLESLVAQKVQQHLAEQQEPRSLRAGAFSLSFEGYGDLRFAHHDYSEDGYPLEGSRGSSRAEFDLARFTLELEAEHASSDIEFEGEIEFEHGGTGATNELDDNGEVEQEIEKGGEVILEELYLRKNFTNGWSVRAGRFYLAMGLLSEYHLPTDYYATSRPETETTLIPGVWDEMGFELQKQNENSRITLQLVNGLDSSHFSADSFIAEGHQSNFETTRAEDLALVGRVDITPVPGLLFGASTYFGDISSNRSDTELAKDANLSITDVHTRYWGKNFRTQTAILYGHISGSEEISKLSEEEAVAQSALGLWSEWTYDLSSTLNFDNSWRVEPFFRFEFYDTYFQAPKGLNDEPRFERYLYTPGIALTYEDFLVTKLDYSIRRFGEKNLGQDNTLTLALSFIY